MKLEDVFSKFNTTPFLFIGSGVTRRYYNLPNWKSLLEHFAREINNDDFSYSAYENRASKLNPAEGLLPKVAELIQCDYDEKWFADPEIRKANESVQEKIKSGLSPFKAEIAEYIKSNSKINEEYSGEIEKLSNLSENNVSGIITTNYDTFVESCFQGYKTYVGQQELIFESIQGIAEIYKIHGSVEEPETIIINEHDYIDFNNRRAYLAAKLLTIFMEYPIVFIGYSISDSDIKKILESIADCLNSSQLDLLENRLIFVEYKAGLNGAIASPFTIDINNKQIKMTKISVSNFGLIYDALKEKKSKLPVRLLRRFKQELYNYTLTHTPTSGLKVASIDDDRIADDEFVLAIGKYSDLGLKGLNGIDADEWYRSIVLDDLNFSSDELIEYAFPKLNSQNSGRLPVNKYLATATKPFEEYREAAKKQDFNSLISSTIKSNRKQLGTYKSVNEVWLNENENLEKATRLIAYLTEDEIAVEELEQLLKSLFEDDVNVLKHPKSAVRTNIRRLIRIYDYLKWGKKELPN